MSYPDLGCFAECLVCELCEPSPPPPDLDLDLDDYDGDFGDDLGLGDPPPEEPPNWWDDFELPPVYPTGSLTEGGFTVGVGGRF
jgi:hypothetical protein